MTKQEILTQLEQIVEETVQGFKSDWYDFDRKLIMKRSVIHEPFIFMARRYGPFLYFLNQERKAYKCNSCIKKAVDEGKFYETESIIHDWGEGSRCFLTMGTN